MAELDPWLLPADDATTYPQYQFAHEFFVPAKSYLPDDLAEHPLAAKAERVLKDAFGRAEELLEDSWDRLGWDDLANALRDYAATTPIEEIAGAWYGHVALEIATGLDA